MADGDEPEDMVFYLLQPFVRPLGNLVLIFSECEAALLELTYFLVGRDRAEAVRILKTETAKDQLIALVRASVLSDTEIEEKSKVNPIETQKLSQGLDSIGYKTQSRHDNM